MSKLTPITVAVLLFGAACGLYYFVYLMWVEQIVRSGIAVTLGSLILIPVATYLAFRGLYVAIMYNTDDWRTASANAASESVEALGEGCLSVMAWIGGLAILVFAVAFGWGFITKYLDGRIVLIVAPIVTANLLLLGILSALNDIAKAVKNRAG